MCLAQTIFYCIFLGKMAKAFLQFILEGEKKGKCPPNILIESGPKNHTAKSVPLIIHNFSTTSGQLTPLFSLTWSKRPKLTTQITTNKDMGNTKRHSSRHHEGQMVRSKQGIGKPSLP